MPIRWRLKEILDARGITPYRLAQLCELQVPTVYRIVNATEIKHIDARTLAKFCAALELQPGDLLAFVPDKKKR